jgi:hypothetical protein
MYNFLKSKLSPKKKKNSRTENFSVTAMDPIFYVSKKPLSKIGLGEIFDNLLRINTSARGEESWDRLEEEH